ncbi:MAG: hypothetical protein RQ715_02875 [Methylococcales bacterium]|nr:hypothetical protein [Methylococcales bacterium]
MTLLKQLAVTFTLLFSALAMVPASAAGKVENATAEEVAVSIADAVKNSQAALSALTGSESDDTVLELIEAARQNSKRIEVGRLDVNRTRAAAHLKKARRALRNGDKAAAEAELNKAIKGYQEVQKLY